MTLGAIVVWGLTALSTQPSNADFIPKATIPYTQTQKTEIDITIISLPQEAVPIIEINIPYDL